MRHCLTCAPPIASFPQDLLLKEGSRKGVPIKVFSRRKALERKLVTADEKGVDTCAKMYEHATKEGREKGTREETEGDAGKEVIKEGSESEAQSNKETNKCGYTRALSERQ